MKKVKLLAMAFTLASALFCIRPSFGQSETCTAQVGPNHCVSLSEPGGGPILGYRCDPGPGPVMCVN
jgi:hypothetical protein